MIIFLLLLCGCAQKNTDGVYVKHVQSGYSIGEDSLFVAEKPGQLFIERHTGFQKIRNNKLTAKQMKISGSVFSSTGSNSWQDTKTGTLLSFSDDGLLLGSAKYQKVK